MLRLYTQTSDKLVHIDFAPETGRLVWADLLKPTGEDARTIEDLVGVAIPSRDEMEEIELSARLYSEDGAAFMTVTVLADVESDDPSKTPVTFILKAETLVTVRYAEPKPFRTFLARAQRQRGAECSCGEQVMLGLLEALVDRTADALERVSNEIDSISREVFRNKHVKANTKHANLRSVMQRVGQKAELLSMIEESLVSIARLVAYHSAGHGTASAEGQDRRQLAKLIQRDALSLGDHARALSARIAFLLDATLGMINLEQNQIIKIFSVAAVVFLPPTLVASVYGMNFALMPELELSFGYPLALGMMVASAVLPFVYFKRRGWL